MDSHHALLTPFDKHAFEQVVQAPIWPTQLVPQAGGKSCSCCTNPTIPIISMIASQQQRPVFPNPLDQIFFTPFSEASDAAGLSPLNGEFPLIYFQKAFPLACGPSMYAVPPTTSVPATTSLPLAPPLPRSPTDGEQSIILKVLSIWGICTPKAFQI
jgi:hypothetical protein